MRAVRLTGPGTLELMDVPVPEPGPGEVRIKVGAAGACHSDLHILDAPAGAYPVPMTLGHEIAGTVDRPGDGVTAWRPGDRAAIYGIQGCGHCRGCLSGRENQCRTVPVGGVGLSRDGGLAEYVVVPASRLLPTGDLELTQAAPLTDAGLTPYHAIELVRPALRPGTFCVVIGIGGLGHMAVQILAATTAVTVIAVDTSDAALELATRVGAHHTFRSDAEAAGRIRALVGDPPDGADVVLDFVSVDATTRLGRTVVATGGHLLLVGLGGGQLTLKPTAEEPPPVPLEVTARIPFWGTRAELQEVIALGRLGRVHTEVETFPLEETVRAYERLRAGDIRGRAVIVP
ncbi:NAD(P)-dependent alcohol dehydrogenase [Polymorphospora sp. NPDC050346]|uniref:NAD(P)-dependent alcohol dehydrogenase n=1 Tax=Polymorphospora sp. NPDC050346 TaxID=3155780 RepID=UPI0033CC3837